MRNRLPADEKRKLIKRVLGGEKITKVCREAGVSRTILYKWIKIYKQAPARSKKSILKAKKPSGRKDWGKLSNAQQRKVVRLAIINPSFTSEKIAKVTGLSTASVWKILKKNHLNTIKNRRAYAERFGKKLVKSNERADRIAIVNSYKQGEKATVICRRYKISRTLFYRWLKRYKEAGEKLSMLEDLRPKGGKHYRYIEGAPEQILQVVVEHPEYSPVRISYSISERRGAKMISCSGVYCILRKLDLNTYKKRLAYAASQAQVQRVFTSEEVDLPTNPRYSFSSSLSPPQKRIFYSYFKYFTAVSSTTFLVSLILVVVIKTLSTVSSIYAGLGLCFALASLFFGIFFFLYSLKYYLSIAMVLSFSRRREEDRIHSWKEFLASIFGFSVSIENEEQEAKSGAELCPGLQADLSNVVLDCKPFVSIHLSTYNEKKVIDRLLTAATSMDYPNYEIVVADDSTDETVELLKRWEHHPRIKISHRDTREGFKGGALKKALEVTDKRAEFILVFDADFIPYPDTITQFLKYFQASAGTLNFGQISNIKNQISNTNLNIQNTEKNGNWKLENGNSSRIAAVQGYQWHVLNKSENWITRGVRSEYSGSYVIERSGEEIYSGLKQISGSVYMIRKDVLESIGWGTSITEDFELTLRLYEQGFKVVYTPYIQAPAEAVSTIKRLVRQRMRWAEGHSFNVKKMFMRLMLGRWIETSKPAETDPNFQFSIFNFQSNSNDLNSNENLKLKHLKFNENFKFQVSNSKDGNGQKVWNPSPLTFSEKLEFLYLSPYYLQAAFFIAGSLCWFLSEMFFRVRLPFWTEVWGWSLVMTNLFALPLMNTIGMFMEESDERDYLGLFSFVAISYLVAPFQAYASVKGFLEKEEGPWFRTPKTGKITDTFMHERFYKFVKSIFGKPAIDNSKMVFATQANPYLSIRTANNAFNNFKIQRKQVRWAGKASLVFLILISMLFTNLMHNVPLARATAGTQIKTVEFYLYQFATTTANDDIASGNGIKDAAWIANTCGGSDDVSKTINLPESGTITVRSAYVEWRTVAVTPQTTSGIMEFCRSGQALTTQNIGRITTNTTASMPINLRLNVTSQIIGGSQTYYYNSQLTGTARNSDSAKLVITYEYDQTSATQLKTVREMVGCQYTQAPAANTTSFTVNPAITDGSATVVDHWVEFSSQNNSGADHQLYAIMNGTNGASVQTDNSVSTGFGITILNEFANNNINLIANNTIGLRNEGGTSNSKCGEWVITYTYSYYTTAVQVKTVRYFAGQMTGNLSTTDTNIGSPSVCVPEATPNYRKVWLRYMLTTNGTNTLTMRVTVSPGAQQTQTDAFAANTKWGGGETIGLYDMTSYFNTNFSPACETVTVDASASSNNILSGVRAEVILTYGFNAATTTRGNKSVWYFAGQAYTNSTAGSAFTYSTLNTYFPDNGTETLRSAALLGDCNHANSTAATCTLTLDSAVAGTETNTVTYKLSNYSALNQIGLISAVSGGQITASPQTNISASYNSSVAHTSGGVLYITYETDHNAAPELALMFIPLAILLPLIMQLYFRGRKRKLTLVETFSFSNLHEEYISIKHRRKFKT